MKYFALFAFMLSTQAFAQTKIEVTPERPAYCKTQNYEKVNWIYDIKKVSEDSDKAVYEFNIQHGSCKDGQVLPVNVKKKWVFLELERNDNALPGILKDGVKSKFSQLDNDELRVEVTFDKKFLFKKSQTKEFKMYFMPGENYGPVYWRRTQNGGLVSYQSKLNFTWNVKLSLDPQSQAIQMKIH